MRFLDGIRAVAQRGRHALIEIGPQAALTALARRCLNADDHAWLASLRRRDSSAGTTLDALAGYYAAGLTVSWADYHADRPAAVKTSLPTYPFQRKRFWLPSTGPRRTGAAARAPAICCSARRNGSPAGCGSSPPSSPPRTSAR
ncbi:hypothetical protein ACFQ60_36565 [Streptomyces zhihengii]